MRDIEEEPFEATLDGVVQNSSGIDEEGFPSTPSGYSKAKKGSGGRMQQIARPKAITSFDQFKSLGDVSACYDRDGKGYLDPVERKVRELDAKNRGLIEPEHVLRIMENLQEEQKRSNELIDTIRAEHKRATGLRRLVVGLTGFVILLAIANIAVSFAAAQLAKEMHVNNQSHDLISQDGERLGTTSKLVQITMEPLNGEEQRHRHLAMASDLVCGPSRNQGRHCSTQGLIRYPEAVSLHQQFCIDYPNKFNNVCQRLGVKELSLNCAGAISTLHGGAFLPKNVGPTNDSYDWGYTVFPAMDRWYHGTTTHFDPITMGEPCIQPFELTLWCLTDGSPCIVIANYDIDVCQGFAPEICGPAGAAQKGL